MLQFVSIICHGTVLVLWWFSLSASDQNACRLRVTNFIEIALDVV